MKMAKYGWRRKGVESCAVWCGQKDPQSAPAMHGGRIQLKSPLNASALAREERVPTAKLKVGHKACAWNKVSSRMLGSPPITGTDGLGWLETSMIETRTFDSCWQLSIACPPPTPDRNVRGLDTISATQY